METNTPPRAAVPSPAAGGTYRRNEVGEVIPERVPEPAELEEAERQAEAARLAGNRNAYGADRPAVRSSEEA